MTSAPASTVRVAVLGSVDDTIWRHDLDAKRISLTTVATPDEVHGFDAALVRPDAIDPHRWHDVIATGVPTVVLASDPQLMIGVSEARNAGACGLIFGGEPGHVVAATLLGAAWFATQREPRSQPALTPAVPTPGGTS